MHSLASKKGQFIPIASMVMLSTLVFMVGLVNVYRISRAKLKAQNLADAVALYIASQMSQSMNNVADRNEWLNHLYINSNDANSAQAGADPCQRTRADKKIPPGLGCFAKKAGDGFKFGTKQGAQAYAQIVATVNNIQNLFAQSYNSFIGASGGASGSNGRAMLTTNLFQQMPALQDPNVFLIVYNNSIDEQRATTIGDNVQKSWTPNSASNQNLVPLIRPIQYKTQDVSVTYNSCATKICFGNHDKTETLSQIIGPNAPPIGWMGLDTSNAAGLYLDPNAKTPALGSGAIVSISVDLIGLGNHVVQAKSRAFLVMTAGQLDPNSNGSFSPTYWVKLGKPS